MLIDGIPGTVLFVARVFVACIFLMAGVTKVGATADMRKSIGKYQLLPSWAELPIAVALPWVEVALALALGLGLATTWIAAILAVLLVLFLVAQVSAVVRRLPVECSCFGLLYVEPVGWRTIMRDAVLLSMTVVVVISTADHFSLPGALSKPDAPGRIAAVCGAVVALAASATLSTGALRANRATAIPFAGEGLADGQT